MGSDAASPSAPPRISRGEWGLILVLVAIQFTHMVDFVIIMPLGGRMMDEFRITTDQFGWIVAAYACAAGVMSLLAGTVMDRFDRRTVLLVMYGAFGVSTLLCGLVTGYLGMVLSRVAAGASGGLAAVAVMAVVGDAFEAQKRGRAAGAVMSAFAVASIAGLPAGLWLADVWGRGAPFVALAGVSAAVWVLAWFRLPPVRGHLSGSRPHPLSEYAAVAREANHRWAFAFSFFLVMGTFTVASFIGPYLMGENGWSENELAVLYMVAGTCTLVGMMVIGRLADRVGRRPLFRVLAIVATVMAVVLTNLPAVPLGVAAVAVALFMVFAAGRMVPAQAILLGAAAPRVRGAFLSLNTSVQHLATGLAPVIAGALLTRNADGRLVGYPSVGLVAAGTAVISLILIGFVRPAATPVVPLPETDPDREPQPTAA